VPFWGERKRKGRILGRADVLTNYYTCSGRWAYGENGCPVSSHVKADDLEAWVLGKLQRFVFADRGARRASSGTHTPSDYNAHWTKPGRRSRN